MIRRPDFAKIIYNLYDLVGFTKKLLGLITIGSTHKHTNTNTRACIYNLRLVMKSKEQLINHNI